MKIGGVPHVQNGSSVILALAGGTSRGSGFVRIHKVAGAVVLDVGDQLS